ncbi:hypothetical protein NEUTE2DRAFT_122973 [Neurospora tetrasperma FGSC 2509]|nr:hypothetical protein NEUTE2DRAFT_122973 [Neurospora tetrasperma FGSC 2509]
MEDVTVRQAVESLGRYSKDSEDSSGMSGGDVFVTVVREPHPGQAQWCVCDVEWVPRRLTDRRFCNASSPVSTSL